MIERLAWDSDFFGYEVGKAEITYVEEILQSPQELDQFQLVYIYTKDRLQKNLLRNMVYLGSMVKFCKGIKTGKNAALPKFFSLDQAEGIYSFLSPNTNLGMAEGIYKGLRELAIKSGGFSRFKLDKRLNRSEFEKLYTTWLQKAISGKERLLVYIKDKNIRGFITIVFGKEKARIGLIAVEDPYCGKGIGSRLLQAAIDSAGREGLEILEVKTQKANLPAMKLYEKTGFKLIEERKVYHWWKIR